MAILEDGGVNHASQAETQTERPRLRMVDDQLNLLIPQEELPFFGHFTRGKTRYFKGHWCIEVPDNFRDAQQLGREMALAFLRVEPGKGDRQDQLNFLSMFILSGQTKALKQGGNAAQVVYSFWGTIASFAEPAATLLNVERYRGGSQEQTRRQKQQDALWAAKAKREKSELAKKAARTRRRRKPAKKGRRS
jgi:hypothetical protein